MMEKIFSGKTFIYSLFAMGGLFAGWILFHSHEKSSDKHEEVTQERVSTIWTCAMHPQIRMDEPGNCPICGMELIPLNQNVSQVDPNAIHFTKEAAALANVQTTKVSHQDPLKEVRLYGKIQADERLLQSQVAHISGRIEKLLVNFTGESVSKGQTLAMIYSPELVTAQQELLEAIKMRPSQPEIYEAAKERLRHWKLTDSQVSKIESSGIVQNIFELVSNSTGIVISRRVNSGDYISQGTVLYEIADLTKVWVMFDAYESDLPFLRNGDKLTFTVNAIPGKNFKGDISFIDPVIDPASRVARVRAEINNTSALLKPEMFAIGIVSAELEEYSEKMIIPRSAVLWTGKRSVVYVKLPDTPDPVFKIREIELGPELENSYVVLNGLNEGEEIVTQGIFSVDAASQLEGKPSMMNRENKEISGMQNNTTFVHVSFKVSGNCEMCKERIENAAKSVIGVSRANWDVKSKKIEVEFNSKETKVDSIHIAIAGTGHDTDKIIADDKSYNSLPGCCRYRN